MRRSGRPRLRPETGSVAGSDAAPAAPSPAAVTWDALSEAERTALRRMNRGPYAALDVETGRRLVALGLAVERPTGIGISRAGRAMVIETLLGARTGDAQS